MAACLHLVVSASTRALRECAITLAAGDSLLFLDEGVLHLVLEEIGDLTRDDVKVAFSVEDLKARGLYDTAYEEGLELLKDSDFPAVLARHPHCLTWK